MGESRSRREDTALVVTKQVSLTSSGWKLISSSLRLSSCLWLCSSDPSGRYFPMIPRLFDSATYPTHSASSGTRAWVWKNNNNSHQTSSCPRDWRLSANLGAQLKTTPETPRTSYSTIALGGLGLPSIGPHYALRDASFSDSRCAIFQSGQFYYYLTIYFLR